MRHFEYMALFLLVGTSSCLNDQSVVHPTYYLASVQEGAVAFQGGKITTTNGICFSQDGLQLYTSQSVEDTATNGRQFAKIFRRDYQDGEWSSPKLVDFIKKVDAYHPVLSDDNQRLFFNSRSHPDTPNVFVPHDIWYADWTNDGWSEPKVLEGINSEFYDSYPSVAKNNNLYFNSDRPGGKGGMDIYLSRYLDGRYQEPINLAVINSPEVENDLVIDPTEQFIIFNRYIDSTKEIDLYIAKKEDDEWQEPIKLDELNQSQQWELTPSLSPDGKYFFYELDNKIMQISLNSLLDH